MFKSQACFDRHKQSSGKSICATMVRCSECHKVGKRGQKDPEKHRCTMTKCPICKENVQADDHQCYMQPVREEESDVTLPKTGTSSYYFLTSSVDKKTGTTNQICA